VSCYKDQWPFFPPDSHKPPVVHPTDFLNDFYDDEGRWALAWIMVFDVTNDQIFLSAAATIFENLNCRWSTPCGGIWWDKQQTYVNAIANELFLSVAAHLANRMLEQRHYLDWAVLEWDWFLRTGMTNSHSLINDGLHLATCRNNRGAPWSYNQGVILGVLVELAKASGNAYIAIGILFTILHWLRIPYVRN